MQPCSRVALIGQRFPSLFICMSVYMHNLRVDVERCVRHAPRPASVLLMGGVALRQFSRGNRCGGDHDKDRVLSEVKCYFESTPSLNEAETPMLAQDSPLDVSLADEVRTERETRKQRVPCCPSAAA